MMRLFLPGQPVTARTRPQRGFGRNRHLAEPRIRQVVSEITGRPVGKIREWGDGRQDAKATVDPIAWTAEDVERLMPLNDLRRLIYESARRSGASHDEAIARLFPDGKVLA
jgi:hypothetical protein